MSLTAPANGATVSGTVLGDRPTTSDDVGVVGVQFLLDGVNLGAEDTTSPYAVSWNTATAANGTHTLAAVARDAAGNTTTSATITVTVPDTTAPTVSITAPANGATVTGTVTVSATASDNVGVVGVQFLLDGVNLGAEDTSSPYSVSWNTATAAPGTHTLTARARDAAGNIDDFRDRDGHRAGHDGADRLDDGAGQRRHGERHGDRDRDRLGQRRRRRRAVPARRREPRRRRHDEPVLGQLEHGDGGQWHRIR